MVEDVFESPDNALKPLLAVQHGGFAELHFDGYIAMSERKVNDWRWTPLNTESFFGVLPAAVRYRLSLESTSFVSSAVEF